MKAILAAAHLMPLVLLALNVGLQRGELLRLRWRDLDLERRLLTVRGEDAKTGQTRHVPLNSQAVAVASAWTPIAMTLRYAHLAPEHKAAAVETLVANDRRDEAA